MQIKYLSFLICLLAFVMPVTLASDDTPTSQMIYPRFESAYHRDNKFIRSEALRDIDWKSLAPEWIRKVDIKKPSRDLINKLKKIKDMFGNSEINYESPIPDKLQKQPHYLISTGGISKLKLRNLLGTARFRLNSKETGILELTFYGDLIAEPTEVMRSLEGGFIMVVNEDCETNLSQFGAKERFTASLQDKMITYSYSKEGSKKLSLILHAGHPTEIKKAYHFSVKGSKYIFVRWGLDPECNYGCCKFSYSLFRANKLLEEIRWTRYGCDI